MLSFDITDRNIRVVKGVESNGKIKISSAATLNLEEGLIVNGHVKDVPNVATLINGALKKNRMPDKEAIVSLSSNLTIFKELTVPRVKPQDMQKTVKMQMQAELNLDDTFCVTYVIVGDSQEKSDSGESMVKVLATACPYEIVNSYREVFKLLGISLKSVMVGCNCITKVLLADTKIKSKMPLLAVQIDPNFISLNLYEQGQLSFSRFASVDPADYGDSPDYVFEAVNENIFRMLQFHRSRNTGEVIENVIFYGDTHEYVRLTDELEKLDLNTNLINVPPQIHGHENLEFSLYANAIGAMFKRNKDTEKINLLETELGAAIKRAASGSAGNQKAGLAVLIALLAGSLVIVGGVWGVMEIIDISINSKIKDIDEFLESPDTLKKLAHREKLLGIKDQVEIYNTKMINISDAYHSQPIINGSKLDELQNVLDETAENLGQGEAVVGIPTYSNGVLTYAVAAEGSKDWVQKLPAEYLDNLLKSNSFEEAVYGGYVVTLTSDEEESGSKAPAKNDDDEDGEEAETPKRPASSDDEFEVVSFTVNVALKGEKSAYRPSDTSSEEEAE